MPKNQPADGVGLCSDLNEIYQSLPDNDDYKKLINEMSDMLLENCFKGNQIPRDRIPRYYIRKHCVNNLYRYFLPEGYRGIYTILMDNDQVLVWILDVFSHEDYDKRFGYS